MSASRPKGYVTSSWFTPSEMQLFVRTCEGRTIALDASPQDDVQMVQELLSGHAGRRFSESEASPESRLIYGGYQLQVGNALRDYGIKNGSTLHETQALFGGGCDGGTTALQRKFMSQASTKKKDENRDLSDEHRAKWEMCAASGAPLQEPIVCCELGYVYKKEAILQQMATKTAHANFKHVRRLKDLFALQLSPNPEYDGAKGSQTRLDWTSAPAKFICPITMKPANGKCPFSALKPCGHVVSEQAVRELGGDGKCPVCGTKFKRGADVIPLNPSPEILTQRRQELEARRAEESKKRARADDEAAAAGAPAAGKAAAAAAPAAKRGATESIHGSLTNSITKSATLGTAAHLSKAKADPVYASMFKVKGTKEYDAAWGQGAMAGVLGGR